MAEMDLRPRNAGTEIAATSAEGTARTVFFDVNPLCERHLTGIGRYSARLALAVAKVLGRPVRFFSQDREVIAPRGLDWSQDQDLGRWSRAVWRGRRARLSPAELPADCMAVYGCLRPGMAALPVRGEPHSRFHHTRRAAYPFRTHPRAVSGILRRDPARLRCRRDPLARASPTRMALRLRPRANRRCPRRDRAFASTGTSIPQPSHAGLKLASSCRRSVPEKTLSSSSTGSPKATPSPRVPSSGGSGRSAGSPRAALARV